MINLKVPGRPSVKAGEKLAIRQLVATPWTMGDRSGVAFRAAEVQPQAKAEKAGGASRG